MRTERPCRESEKRTQKRRHRKKKTDNSSRPRIAQSGKLNRSLKRTLCSVKKCKVRVIFARVQFSNFLPRRFWGHAKHTTAQSRPALLQREARLQACDSASLVHAGHVGTCIGTYRHAVPRISAATNNNVLLVRGNSDVPVSQAARESRILLARVLALSLAHHGLFGSPLAVLRQDQSATSVTVQLRETKPCSDPVCTVLAPLRCSNSVA